MAIPDFQTLMLPLLRLSASEKEWRTSDAVAVLADQFNLTQEERAALLPSGRQSSFANRVHWARTYLGKAGLVAATKRAHFRISNIGLKVLTNPPDRITIRYLTQFPAFQEFRKASGDDQESEAKSVSEISSETSLTPDEIIRAAHRRLEKELAGELLTRIRSNTPAFFEKLVVRLLFAMGYGGSVAEISKALVGGSGDGGVDGVIDQDILGLDRIYVQAKRYAEDKPVGPASIRDFFGSLDRFKASKGLFVTASSFTSSARETALSLSKRIVLMDGEQLTQLMIRYDVGCRIEQTLSIKEIDEEFFE